MFSQVARRLHAETNPLYRLRDELVRQGITITDLVSGNVNELGIVFPAEDLESVWIAASRQAKIYRPDSFGQPAAREAVSGYYRDRGVSIPPGNILLTPGTSIAYWYCFKLLADEGDEILCPQPSYPLFDYIAALSGTRLIPYRLLESDGWSIDLEHLESTLSTRTKAVVLISPHNPTGCIAGIHELEALAEIAARHNLAIISDEVFSEFLLEEVGLPRPAAFAAPLVLTLNGFSKMFALPGLKLGWLAVTGEEDKTRQALRALELISDTFLPVNEIVQAAVPGIFARGAGFLAQYRDEIRKRWQIAWRLISCSEAISFCSPRGGFYVTLKLKDAAEDTVAESILRSSHCLVHPGYYYDMKPHHIVLSFVHTPGLLESALPALLRTIEESRQKT
jgi:alanine-synthesizing transaminase